MDRVGRDEVFKLAWRAALNGQRNLSSLLFAAASDEWGVEDLYASNAAVADGVKMANKLGIGIGE